MPLACAESALEQARQLLSLPAGSPGEAWHVRRLDGAGDYFLVHVAGQLACLDTASGALLASAVAPRTPISVGRETAVALAGLGSEASVELVWTPCAATLSMFDPLWSVLAGERVVFVDQRSNAWPALPPKPPGGGAG
jgi:hypothetical protein